jgi:hypothetical protein
MDWGKEGHGKGEREQHQMYIMRVGFCLEELLHRFIALCVQRDVTAKEDKKWLRP